MVLTALVTFGRGTKGQVRRLVPLFVVMGLQAVLLLAGWWEGRHYTPPIYDYYPPFGLGEIIGTWESRRGTLVLNAEGGFAYGGVEGYWTSEGTGGSFLLVGEESWCIFQRNGQLKLLRPEDCEWDADNWSYSQEFSRTEAGEISTTR
jgi:hypothetical protein